MPKTLLKKIIDQFSKKQNPQEKLETLIGNYREFASYTVDETVVIPQKIHIPKVLPSEPPQGVDYQFEATGYFTKNRNSAYCTIPTEWRNVNNYCHWTLTEIPLMALALESSAPTIVLPDALLNASLPFQKRWLKVLQEAYPEKNILPLSKNKDKLDGILPVNQDTSVSRHLIGKCEYTWYHRSRATPYTLDLMERLKPNFKPLHSFEGDKVYINRKNGRRLSNEEEVQEFVKNQGFKIINLEDYSLDDQVALFGQASIIMGFHGAGLCNLVFSTPHQKVIEIVDADCVYPCYKDGIVIPGKKATRTHFHMIAHMKNLQYSVLESKEYFLNTKEIEVLLTQTN